MRNLIRTNQNRLVERLIHSICPSSLWTGFRIIRKGRREPVGIGYIFEFYKSNLKYKRLLLLVPNFNATSDENGVIDQS